LLGSRSSGLGLIVSPNLGLSPNGPRVAFSSREVAIQGFPAKTLVVWTALGR
jgi:hypothetical protein